MLDAIPLWPPIAWIKVSTWAYPSLEALHLIGLGLLFGTIWLVDMALVGWVRADDLPGLAAQVLPWTLAGFALSAVTGTVLFLTQPGDMIGNPAFLIKMGLIGVAGTNAALLHLRGALDPASALTRWQAGLSMGVWAAVVVAGRWIAYL